jgi:hypothetical protein
MNNASASEIAAITASNPTFRWRGGSHFHISPVSIAAQVARTQHQHLPDRSGAQRGPADATPTYCNVHGTGFTVNPPAGEFTPMSKHTNAVQENKMNQPKPAISDRKERGRH